ncbi:hypothetical protein K6119_18955 [Paracrocinitomix mangrovi]|uniref:hypothetical protein n=1 Tax=Paracrocinitomix mangrovi TaxID=2862509 RepID=UPI001C8F0A31|nr:hypothetical protein [Paracrocinitomix mangrovi]UKN01805.1 hypothetical protein K6119_18955 [Paracrocinitomix mangrovi]
MRYFGTVLIMMLLVACAKPNDTVQQKLDNGVTIADILTEFPVDSLYGKTYAQGLIYHVNTNTNTVYVMSKVNVSTSAVWGCAGSTINGADSIAWGYGNKNTEEIIADCGNSQAAAGLCYYDNNEGRTDWYLPSAEEAFFIYNNVYLNGYGNFSSSDELWSSSEIDGNQAYFMNFSSGNYEAGNKNDFKQVRAVRKE